MIYNYPYHRNYYNRFNSYNYNKYTNKLSENITSQNTSCDPIEVIESDDSKDKECITILGIKLYFDDLIILGLLYLLYSENIKDMSLYIVLILLLLD